MRKNSIFIIALLFVLVTIIPILAPQKAVASSKFADGEYSVPFTVLKGTSDEQSTTADYVVSPAKVIVQNGKTHVVMTLNNSSWWQYFKVNSADVQVLSDSNDKRVVKFEVGDIEQLVNAKIHIIVTGIPGFNYDNKYDIRFKFNSSSIPLAPVAEKPAETPAPKPENKPSQVEKGPAVSSSKPVEKKAEKKQETGNNTVQTTEDSKEKTDTSDTAELESEKEPESDEAAEKQEEVDIEEEELEEQTEEELEEVPDLTEEQVVEEIESEKTEKSNSGFKIFIIILFAFIIGGGTLFIFKNRKQA